MGYRRSLYKSSVLCCDEEDEVKVGWLYSKRWVWVWCPKFWENQRLWPAVFIALFGLKWNDYFVLRFVRLTTDSCGYNWVFTYIAGP